MPVAGYENGSLINSCLNLQDMLFTELDDDDRADYFHDCSKNLNNSVAYWMKFVREYYDIELTEHEALQQRAGVRADEDKGDRYHNQLRNDGPWI